MASALVPYLTLNNVTVSYPEKSVKEMLKCGGKC